MDRITVPGGIAAFAISFLGFGVVWIGQPGLQACVAALFLMLAYTLSHVRNRDTALLATALPAAPIAWLIAQFRDVNDSHAISIAIVLTWTVAILLGALAADRTRTSYRRFLVCVAGMTVFHAVAAATALLFSFGASMDRFDGQPQRADAEWIGAVADLLMRPALTPFIDSNIRIGPAAQWLAFGVNSLTWGAALGVLLACVLRLGKPGARPV